MVSVADRFQFPEWELRSMPISRLKWWYEAVVELTDMERREANGTTDN
jgi:hypothetical protein